MVRNWYQALLAQARADYDLYVVLADVVNVPVCYQIEMLQKSLEKLLKALSANAPDEKGINPKGIEPPESTHKTSDKFLSCVSKFFDPIGIRMNFPDSGSWGSYVNTLKAPIALIEYLTPSAKKQARNSEYPWEERVFDPEGVIQVNLKVPALEDWQDWVNDAPQVVHLRKFLNACFEAMG
jgi:hypothetical protein